MKRFTGILILGLVLVFALSECENAGQDEGSGTLMIQTFDAPFQGDVDHIYLNIIQVSVHQAVADSSTDSTDGWIVLSEVDTTIDFLELVNGQMATLLDESLDAGHYSQLRLMLGGSSAIVVDSISYELRVPSGSESGVKLNLGFTIEENEIAEIYLDFDAARSINKHPTQDRYSLQPTFKVFRSVLSGTISGTVVDSLGLGLEDVVVQAVYNGDTTSTISDTAGHYQFILLEGSYDLSAEAFELAVDTSYSTVSLSAGEQLTAYDFTMK